MLEGLVAGEEAALANAYDHYAPRVYGLALRIAGDAALAEEIIQDVFVAAWRHRGTFDAQRGSLYAWLLTATRNRTIDLARGRARQRKKLEQQLSHNVEASQNVEASVLRGLDQRAIAAALAALPPEQRHAVQKAYYEGLTAREIADELRIPLSTVKGRLRLGLQRLARDLELREATRSAA